MCRRVRTWHSNPLLPTALKMNQCNSGDADAGHSVLVDPSSALP